MDILKDIKGQGTVEAAFVIPILFLLTLLLLEPGIVLFDYIVMNNAAEEGARLAATTDLSSNRAHCTDFIRHRLGAVPQQDLFHVHSSECSWQIEITGGESSELTSVVIRNEIRPLPFLDMTLGLLGAVNGKGTIDLCVERTVSTQPSWVFSAGSGSPSSWVESW